MATTTLTTFPSGLIAVGTTDEVVKLSPRRIYQIQNYGAVAVYYSTGGGAVVADDTTGADKGKLPPPVSGMLGAFVDITGVSELRLKCASSTGLVNISHKGSL